MSFRSLKTRLLFAILFLDCVAVLFLYRQANAACNCTTLCEESACWYYPAAGASPASCEIWTPAVCFPGGYVDNGNANKTCTLSAGTANTWATADLCNDGCAGCGGSEHIGFACIRAGDPIPSIFYVCVFGGG